MNKVIVTTGYMGSGSSAMTGLVSEYKDVINKFGSFEYVFLHCPDGVFDLEDKLLKGNNALRSDEAIRNFRKCMYKLYDKKYWWVGNYKQRIGTDFKKITDEYIESLINCKIDGYWYLHEDTDFKMFIKLCIQKVVKLLTLNKYKGKKNVKYKEGMNLAIPTEKEFYEKTSKYIYDVINLVSNKKDEKSILLDQLLLPYNLHRIDKYFNDDLRVIVVDRDPRDVFILNKYTWIPNNNSIPFPTDVDDFCDIYLRMRESEKNIDTKKVLRIQFEDMIYNYEDIVKKVEKFMGFTSKDHIKRLKSFDPSISIKNTQLFNDSRYKEEVNVIKKKLNKYIYDFPYKLVNKVEETKEFDD